MYKNNEKVAENYFFMTALQLLSSAFGILIYPYLIRVLGSESYGTYVFAIAIVSYFTSFISFGFNLPGLKIISQNKEDALIKNNTVSGILTLKLFLGFVSILIFITLVCFVPFLNQHRLIFIFAFMQIIAEIIYPVWFFQAIQKMKIVTYFQLLFRILSVPFIFIYVKSPDDVILFTIISSSSIILPAISLYYYLIKVEKINIRLLKIDALKKYWQDAMPFFWSTVAGTIKQESVTLILGSFFSMHNVALYDLANKLIMLPRMLTTSINTAIFPKVIKTSDTATIKKIIRYEWFIGLAMVGFIILFGYWIILILGGKAMTEAYPLSIILSFTILVWLVVGSYINFIFVPQNKYYFATQNQIVALVSFALLALPGMLLIQNIFVLISALTLSGVCEIVYCRFLIKKHKLL